MPEARKDPHEKALALNLDPKIYGSIAEIGAGQEVARWFFRVGGAAGTVAKTISAYDMSVSDQIYGKGSRYVSQERVVAMLDREFEQLLARLGPSRAETRFFTFANTISARNYSGTNECHGWLGLRYQHALHAAPSQIVLHVNMNDSTNQRQCEALGILGINLIYGAFHLRDSRDEFLQSLIHGLEQGRIEVDFIQISGPENSSVPEKEIGSSLLKNGLAEAVLFDRNGSLATPSEVFHNRPIVISRKNLSAVSDGAKLAMLNSGLQQLQMELAENAKSPVGFLEVNVTPDSENNNSTEILGRISEVLGMSDWLLATKFEENYKLTAYLRRYAKTEPIRFVVSISDLVLLMQHKYYSELPGQLLEGLSRFMASNVKVYIWPMPAQDFKEQIQSAGERVFSCGNTETIDLESLQLNPPISHLYKYLCELGVFVSLTINE